jgi:hypothetical protein
MRQRGRRKDRQSMATSEAGGIVPEELRERIADVLDGYGVMSGGTRIIEDVFAEIAAAGYELVPVDRMERLRYAASHPEPARGSTMPAVVLMPGDLDRPGGAE